MLQPSRRAVSSSSNNPARGPHSLRGPGAEIGRGGVTLNLPPPGYASTQPGPLFFCYTMPTTYKTTRGYYEAGVGRVVDVVVVSDEIGDLIEIGTATEVGVYAIESTKKTLDSAKGSVVEAELSLDVSATEIMSVDDAAALDFILEGLNPLTPRYIGRFINPATPTADPEVDAAFIGIIRTTGSATDKLWHGTEYDTAPAPVRSWKLKARPYEIAELFGASLEDVFLGVPDAFDVRSGGIAQDASWIAANVADRLGYAIIPSDSTAPYREARYGDLVAFEPLIQKILDTVAPPGTTITYESTEADFVAVPYCFAPSTRTLTGFPFGGSTVHKFRYGIPGDSVQHYYEILAQEQRMMIGGDPAVNGSLYVHFKNIIPALADREFSWLQYSTVAGLLAALAQNFGMFLDVQYVSLTEITVRFKARSSVGDTPATYVRDVKQADLNIEHMTPDKGERFTGQATRFNAEGGTAYVWDGFGSYQPPYWQGPREGQHLPLTVSPSLVRGTFSGNDASIDLSKTFGGWWLPTGVSFWNDGPPASVLEHGGLRYDYEHRAECNTAMFMRIDGPPDAAGITLNCEGETVWAPVGRIRAVIGGKEREYGYDWRRVWDLGLTPTSDPTDPATPGYGISSYLNDLFGIDEAYFDNTYSLTVPGLCPFRSSPTGPDDWRNLSLGSLITIDGVAFRVIDIDRRTVETVIKLQASTRFVYTVPSAGTAQPAGGVTATVPAPSSDPVGITPQISGGVRTGTVIGLTAGEAIAAFQAVAYVGDRIYVATAHHDHYKRVVGVALEAGVTDDLIAVQINGVVAVGVAFSGFTEGNKVYLRTGATSADPNLSETTLLASGSGEDLHREIGVYVGLGPVAGGGILMSYPQNEYMIQPEV